MKKDKGPWENKDLPPRAKRAEQRELLGIVFDEEHIQTAIAVNRSRSDICTIFRTDEHELDDWARQNYGGMSWDEYYRTIRLMCIEKARAIVQDLAKAGHVKALEISMKDLLGDDAEDSSRRITIDMNIGDGKDEK